MRDKVSGARRWVVKIGSALLTADGRGLDQAAMAVWVDQMVALRAAGVELVLVSSGAVAAGMSRLGWASRPKAVHELQAAAAVGQMGLIRAWESSFARCDQQTAQILVTHDDLSDRKRYLNARSTLRTLIDLGVVPVINENDTVVTDEIRFGDNDTLAALVANLVEADLLVILTDRDGMFDADPRHNPEANLISEARADDPALDAVAGGTGGALGRGGMQTKLRAARLAARSGAHTVIVGGRIEQVGSPMELYHHPANLFVAGFLGTPKMGFLNGRASRVEASGCEVELDAGCRLFLPVSGATLKAGDPVTLGIRPEHLNRGSEGNCQLTVKADVSERLGSDTYCHVVTGNGEQLTMRIRGDFTPRYGESLSLTLEAAHCHLFDSSGQAVGQPLQQVA